ncbi:MAG: class I SAM-dependent methyltransferase [Planctomycetes bacterium]|nr:class I SAM-dependent methyltransferase [Planctomycetota bacterium]
MSLPRIINKTLDPDDLRDPLVSPTARSIRRWVWRWLLSGCRLGVNGHVKRRAYIRPHKMWEYSRGLALTGASAPARRGAGPLRVLDVGGAMTAPILYLASLGDAVVCLDIDEGMTAETNRAAGRRGLRVNALTTNLAEEDPTGADLGAPGGFDRVYCFCVIEHIVPPGQARVAERMGRLLRPGGQMVVTFDYGEDAPTEAPMYTASHVETFRAAVGLPLIGNDRFVDNGKRYPLERRHPERSYTFGSLFFHRPE